jgi:hypothetical protein
VSPNLAKIALQAQEAAMDRRLLIRQHDDLDSTQDWRLAFNLRQSIYACERTIIQLASLIIFPVTRESP